MVAALKDMKTAVAGANTAVAVEQPKKKRARQRGCRKKEIDAQRRRRRGKREMEKKEKMKKVEKDRSEKGEKMEKVKKVEKREEMKKGEKDRSEKGEKMEKVKKREKRAYRPADDELLAEALWLMRNKRRSLLTPAHRLALEANR